MYVKFLSEFSEETKMVSICLCKYDMVLGKASMVRNYLAE